MVQVRSDETVSPSSHILMCWTAAPHGPDMSGHHNPVHQITENERQIFQYLIRPDDSYDEHGVYWADMPIGKRIKFVTNYDNAEAARELSAIGRMMRADPLSPVGYYFRNMVLPGAGLGLEGLVHQSISRSGGRC